VCWNMQVGMKLVDVAVQDASSRDRLQIGNGGA
jgi:hypothetical protein